MRETPERNENDNGVSANAQWVNVHIKTLSPKLVLVVILLEYAD